MVPNVDNQKLQIGPSTIVVVEDGGKDNIGHQCKEDDDWQDPNL